MLFVLAALLLGHAALPELPVALVIEYADGRRTSTILGARTHRSWTPLFPRIAGWHPAEGGEPVAAIQYVAAREGETVRVKVGVLFGRPHRRELDVAELLVVHGRTVPVEELRQFGVEPVRLSLAPVGPLALFPPNVETATDGLDVTVDLITEAPPRYRVAVRNRTGRAVAGFGVESSRRGRPALTTRKGDPFGAAIVPPGETYTFDLTNSGALLDGPAIVSPEPFDTIAITFVLWEDGTHEGDARTARERLDVEAARRAQLVRIVGLLDTVRAAAPERRLAGLAALRRELARDPYDTMVRAVADDVRRLRKAADASDENFRSLVEEMRARYTLAVERLSRRAAISRR